MLGSKIRALRTRLQPTLEEAATASGISKPFLSQVERSLATPSITSSSAATGNAPAAAKTTQNDAASSSSGTVNNGVARLQRFEVTGSLICQADKVGFNAGGGELLEVGS